VLPSVVGEDVYTIIKISVSSDQQTLFELDEKIL